MKKKKNRFLLFWCSLVPGAGEMYLGFMKTGVSLLSLFALTILVTVFTNIGVLALAVMVVWVYGFFHANNLGAMNDEEFYRMEDRYLFGIDEHRLDSVWDSMTGRYRKGCAVVLIALGISMLWQTFCRILRHVLGDGFYDKYISWITNVFSNEVPKIIVGIAIIWLGIKLIQGKKAELDRLEEKEEIEEKSELMN